MRVYITFGQSHVHACGGKTLDKDCVATFEAASERDGRERAFELFGDQWHQCLTEMNEQTMAFFLRGFIEV